jgi:hypothetical protein
VSDPKAKNPDTVTYGDHEVITPDTKKLRKLIRPAKPGEEDPVARAEHALAQMSNEFPTWMRDECNRLDAARKKIKEAGMTKETCQELFLAAHDVKGDASTFGFPAAAPVADSLCRLIDHTPDQTRIPVTLIDQHVDAVRAIVREYPRVDILKMAGQLSTRLRQVTDEFLVNENRHRPEYLKSIISPPMAPTDF